MSSTRRRSRTSTSTSRAEAVEARAVLAGHRRIDLPSIDARVARLPVVLRILLENVARTNSGEQREASIRAILDWERSASSDAEIEVQPVRVLMHDTTSTPALVDIAGMRDSLA